MRNTIKIDDKIGFLNPKNGRYMFSVVVGMDKDKIQLRSVIRLGKNHTFINNFENKTEDIIKWLKEPSKDWKDGRTLLKHKSVNKNYLN